MIFLVILIGLATFFGTGVILNAVLSYCSHRFHQDLPFSRILAFGFGPILLSFLLYFLFWFFPYKQNIFYILAIALVFLILAIFFRRWLKVPITEIIKNITDFFTWKDSKFQFTLRIIFCLAILYIFVQAVAFPIMANDASVYKNFGEMLARDKSLANYPTLQSDKITGFYFNNIKHAPTLPLLYAWFNLFGNDYGQIVRIIAPLYFLYLAILLWLSGNKLKEEAGDFCLLLLLLTPLIVSQTYNNSIDPIRLYTVFSTTVVFGFFLQKPSIFKAILTGIFLGFACFMHGTGFVLFFGLLISYLLFFREKMKKLIMYLLIIFGLAFLIGGNYYLLNKQSNRAPIRIINQSVNLNKVVKKTNYFNRFQIFLRPEYYGPIFYVFTVSLFFLLKKKNLILKDRAIILSSMIVLFGIIFFYFDNPRYVLMVAPISILYSSWFIGDLTSTKKKTFIFSLIIILLLILIAASFVIFSSVTDKLNSKTNKIKYIFSNKVDQARLLEPGFFEAIDFLNSNTTTDEIILTSDNGRFYNLCSRKGIYWLSPEVKVIYTLDGDQVVNKLKDLKIKYVFIDRLKRQGSNKYYQFLVKILDEEKNAKKIFDNGAVIYQINQL